MCMKYNPCLKIVNIIVIINLSKESTKITITLKMQITMKSMNWILWLLICKIGELSKRKKNIILHNIGRTSTSHFGIYYLIFLVEEKKSYFNVLCFITHVKNVHFFFILFADWDNRLHLVSPWLVSKLFSTNHSKQTRIWSN